MTEQETYSAYPLQWPIDQPRTPSHERDRGRFEGTQEIARQLIVDEVNRLVLGSDSRHRILRDQPIISTNMPLRRDGHPYSATRRIDDPGVAVYFQRDGQWVCIACDQYDAIWKNMKAIAKTIEAMRGIQRWGSRELLDRAFTGFAALPEKSEAITPWEILNIPSGSEAGAIKRAHRDKFRKLQRLGANDDQLRIINEARDMCLKSVSCHV